MEDIDERYENGVIYMIKHKTDDTKEYYIGSSYDFKNRCSTHKSNCNNEKSKDYNLKVYQYIRENGNWNEWTIVKLYDYPCKNKNELHLEEQIAVKEYKSKLNSRVPARTQKEYCIDNKDKILEQRKEYRNNNKEKIAQKDKEYRNNNKEKILERLSMKINCDICNAIVSKGKMARHKRSQKCKNYSKIN